MVLERQHPSHSRSPERTLGSPLRQNGFTLLEIMIVVGILAIVFSIGFPQFATYQRALVMREVSNQIAQLLRDTGARAKAETNALTVNFLLNRTDGADFSISSGVAGSLPTTVKLERDASIDSVSMSGLARPSVTFDVRGRPHTAAPLLIDASFSDQRSKVRLLTTGKTVIQ